MGGSKKGEHRGNARKRPAKPDAYSLDAHADRVVRRRNRQKHRTHETPNEIMREACRNHHEGPNAQVTIERRIQISRVILGNSGAAEDVTPKEMLLQGMHHNLQAVYDWKNLLLELSQLPPTPENTLAVERAEREIERLYDKAGEFAFKCGPFIHPKLQAVNVTGVTGANQVTILQELMDEVDQLERNTPIPIEHKPQRTG